MNIVWTANVDIHSLQIVNEYLLLVNECLPHDITQTHKCYEQACVYKATVIVHLSRSSSQMILGDNLL